MGTRALMCLLSNWKYGVVFGLGFSYVGITVWMWGETVSKRVLFAHFPSLFTSNCTTKRKHLLKNISGYATVPDPSKTSKFTWCSSSSNASPSTLVQNGEAFPIMYPIPIFALGHGNCTFPITEKLSQTFGCALAQYFTIKTQWTLDLCWQFVKDIVWLKDSEWKSSRIRRAVIVETAKWLFGKR